MNPNMMKLLPQEIELWYVIPALRREFAMNMSTLGMKNVKIAEVLGLTKAAVSQYFSKTRAVEFKFGEEIKNEIRESVARIINGQEPRLEMQRIINILRENKSVCKFHHLKEKLDKDCDMCFK